MENISQNVNIEMLEKLPDGTYKRKYPKTRADDGTTFDEHLADYASFKGSKGQPSGLAELDEEGKIPFTQIGNKPGEWEIISEINITEPTYDIEFTNLDAFKELEFIIYTRNGNRAIDANMRVWFNNNKEDRYGYSNLTTSPIGGSENTSTGIEVSNVLVRSNFPHARTIVHIYNTPNQTKSLYSINTKRTGVYTTAHWDSIEDISTITLNSTRSSSTVFFDVGSTIVLKGAK